VRYWGASFEAESSSGAVVSTARSWPAGEKKRETTS
jgi:hypothetical protein